MVRHGMPGGCLNTTVANADERAAAAAPLAAAIANFAHELANPLNTIAMTSELARRMLARGQGEKAMHALENIGADCNRCARLLRDAQDFLSMEIGEISSEVDLEALLEEAGEPLKKRGEIAQSASSSRYLLHGDARALRRMFSELLSNAFEHGARRLEVDLGSDGRQLCIRFRDDGPGIDPAVMPRIFDPFFSTDRQQRSGIGLAIARAVAEAHGGDVDAERAEQGAAFRVRLPLEVVATGES